VSGPLMDLKVGGGAWSSMRPGRAMAACLITAKAATHFAGHSFVVVNLKTVTWWNVCPGFSSVVGKLGWFGESG
jgi:hypothetical protein